MNIILTIFFFFLIISLLVFVHELGHFAAAKISKIHVKEFAIGFGKVIFQRFYKGTYYSIRLFPLGGFVELEGENENTGPNSFRNKPFLVKFFVLIAGVVVNFVFAALLLSAFLASSGYKFALPNLSNYSFNGTYDQQSLLPITVSGILENSRSANQIFEGESIVGINSNRFESFEQFSNILEDSQNTIASFEFINFQTYETYFRDVRLGEKNENGAILDLSLIPESKTYFLKYNQNITSGFSMSYDISIYQLNILGGLIANSFSSGNFSELSKSVGGLPAVTNQINQAVEYEAVGYLIPLTAFISLSLAIFNILPFPALDGGQIVINFIESVSRRRIPDKILSRINLSGFIFLIILSVLINLKDLFQLGWVRSIIDIFSSSLGR
jgi:regulator of sigma E protease